jgi:UDP-N-acetylmuramoyl-tripeptide--D-alanyl-D-alanine ligase
MIKLTKNQILSWTGGENNFKDYNPKIANVVTDSRKIQENDCYIAIKGENFDGNDFIEQAINNKASVILSNRQSSHKEVITVEDTVIALGNIAKNYLMQFDIKKLQLRICYTTCLTSIFLHIEQMETITMR